MEEKAMPSVWSTKPRVGHAVGYPKPSKKSTNGLGPGGLGFESGYTNPNQQLTISWTNGKAKNKKHKVPMAMKHVFFLRIHLFKTSFVVRSHVATLPPIIMVQCKPIMKRNLFALKVPILHWSMIVGGKTTCHALTLSVSFFLYPHPHASQHKGNHSMNLG